MKTTAKKIICVLLCCAVPLSLLSACGKDEGEKKPEPAGQQSGVYFQLEELPSLPKYTDKSLVYSRRSPAYTDSLKPAKDYGKLIPFIGDARYYTAEYGGDLVNVKYGLMTMSGEIVVDAVYEGARTVALDNGDYILELRKPTPKHVNQDGYDYWEEAYDISIAASDGSWVISGEDCGFVLSACENRIVCSKPDFYYTGYSQGISVYDYSGKFIYSLKDVFPSAGGYKDGKLSLEKNIKGKEDEYGSYEMLSEAYLADLNGKLIPATQDVVYYEEQNGRRVFSMGSSSWGVVDSIGRVIIKNDNCYNIESLDGLYFRVGSSSGDIMYDANGNEVIADFSNGYFVLGGKLISCADVSSKSGEYTLNYYIAGGDAIKSDETGEIANGVLKSANLFYSLNGGKFTAFDLQGKTKLKIENCISADEYINADGKAEDFFWVRYIDSAGNPKCSIYSAETLKQIFTVDDRESPPADEGDAGIYFQDYCGNCAVICKYYSNYSENTSETDEAVYNFSTGKCIADKLLSASVFEFGGKVFISAANKNYCTVYDEQGNIILNIKNQYTD